MVKSTENLAKQVAAFECSHQQLGNIRATLLVNFGPSGRVLPLIEDDKSISTHDLMCWVLKHYTLDKQEDRRRESRAS